MRFEDLPPDRRHDAERTACRFLVTQGYVSLDEACQARETTLPQLWEQILREAGVPDCDPPVFTPFA
ncbi:MAG: hypothetical protein NHG36_00130 [Chromatiaceae bacterium]|nr:hypothetical protein [Candidatus Thioaporhodococcus sediminis]